MKQTLQYQGRSFLQTLAFILGAPLVLALGMWFLPEGLANFFRIYGNMYPLMGLWLPAVCCFSMLTYKNFALSFGARRTDIFFAQELYFAVLLPLFMLPACYYMNAFLGIYEDQKDSFIFGILGEGWPLFLFFAVASFPLSQVMFCVQTFSKGKVFYMIICIGLGVMVGLSTLIPLVFEHGWSAFYDSFIALMNFAVLGYWLILAGCIAVGLVIGAIAYKRYQETVVTL